MTPYQEENLKKGKATQFKKGDPRTIENAGKGGRKYSRNLKIKNLMSTLLSGEPMIRPELEAKMQNLGIDTSDPDQRTVMALMGITVIQQALGGDLDAIKLALEMAGQNTDARTQIERERLALEKEKLKLLKQQANAKVNGVEGGNGILPEIIEAVKSIE